MNRLESAIKSLWQSWGGMGSGRVRVSLPGSRYDYESEAGRLWLSSPVGHGVKWLGDQITRPRLVVNKVTAKGEYTPLPLSPVAKLWKRPNPAYSARTMSKALALSLETEGNAFLWKRRDWGARGQVAELWWINPINASPLYPSDGSEYLSGWEFEVDGGTVKLPASDVIHIRDGIDPDNDRLGLSPLKAHLRQICGHNEAAVYTAAILRNAGVAGLIVAAKSRFGVGQADLAAAKIDDAITGEGRGRTVAFDGEVSVDHIGFSPEQLALDKIPATQQGAILAAMGLSAQALGLPDAQKTYDNYETALRAAWQNGVVPLAELIADGLELGLIPEFENPDTTCITWDWSDVEALQEDESLKHQRWRDNYKEGLCELNEAREALGLDPHPDGDEFVAGKKPGEEPPVPLAMGGKIGGKPIPNGAGRDAGTDKSSGD